MLWLDGERLRFIGDNERWEITRPQLLRIDRIADGCNTTALAGTRHVVVTILDDQGKERRIRFHSEGVVTLGGKRRAADELGRVLVVWKGEARAE